MVWRTLSALWGRTTVARVTKILLKRRSIRGHTTKRGGIEYGNFVLGYAVDLVIDGTDVLVLGLEGLIGISTIVLGNGGLKWRAMRQTTSDEHKRAAAAATAPKTNNMVVLKIKIIMQAARYARKTKARRGKGRE